MTFKLSKVVFLSVFLCISGISQAQTYNKLGNNYYSCGVPLNEFSKVQSRSENGGKQERDNWCWAACIQMVLNYHNLEISQRDVVKTVYGSPVDKPGSITEMLTALNTSVPDRSGNYLTVHGANAMADNISDIVNLLAEKHPLIVGLNNPDKDIHIGHSFVLTEIYFSYKHDKFGNVYIVPDKVVLCDPAPEDETRQEVEWTDFRSRLNMMVKTWIG